MPVNTCHPIHHRFISMWRKCRVVVEGEDSVKAGGTTYLPMLSDQTNVEYEAYKTRASFYNASGRTVEGLAGAVVRKKAEIKVPPKVEDILPTIGAKNQPLDILVKETLKEELAISRVGMHVDAPDVPNAPPYVALYYAEDVINWQKALIDGKEEYTLVVIAEKKRVIDPKDPFVTKEEDRWRVLRLVTGTLGERNPQTGEDTITTTGEGDVNRTYVVEVWRERKSEEMTGNPEDKFIVESTTVPRKWGGKPWDRIPFLFCTPCGLTDEVEEPVILDLANVNLSLYRNSADYEHGLHFTALPTVWVAGFDNKTPLRVGANNAWVTENEQAKCGMLEFTGAGLGSISDTMEAKKRELAVLGARLLEEQKREAEAAATVTLRQAGEQSILSNVARNVSAAWTQVLRWVADWMAAPTDSVSVELSQDFVAVTIDAPTLAQISADVQAGLTSWDTYFYNLQRAEMVPDNVDAEEERQRIEAGVPMAKPTPAQQFELEKQKQAAQAAAELKQTPPAPPPTKPMPAA